MGLKIKTHYSFYLFLFFIVYFGGFFNIFYYFISLIIHELNHYFMSRNYGVMSESMYIYPFGVSLNVNKLNKSDKEKFLIYFAGPFSNILLSLICVAVWWCFPTMYFYLKDFVFVNIVLGVFNLIPIVPLDGGNIFLLFFKTKNTRVKVIKLMRIFSIIFSIFFLILFIVSCFFETNFSCFCISFFLFSASLNSSISYDNIMDHIEEKKVKECKIYVVNIHTKLCELYKYFDSSKYVQFYLVNDDHKIVKIVSQEDILKMQ